MDNFEAYLRQGEPNKAEKAKVWKMAIGLQQVDGLKPSEYLISTARQNIEGDITKQINILFVFCQIYCLKKIMYLKIGKCTFGSLTPQMTL